MSYTNPYAAPQTLESTLDLRKLPRATLASSGMLRRVLPTVTTRELARLVKQSRSLNDMQLVWMWVTPFLLLAIFVCFCIRDFDFDDADTPHPLTPLAIGAGICLARLLLGQGRSIVGRYFGLLLDSVLVAACVALLTFLTQRWIGESFLERCWLVMSAAFLGFPIYFGHAAVVAMLEARVLFGKHRCRPQELLDEYDYRRELGIE